MSRNFFIVAWVCLFAGCINHEAARAENLARSAPHNLALEVCFQKAVETKQTTHDDARMSREFDICADAADAKYGRKK